MMENEIKETVQKAVVTSGAGVVGSISGCVGASTVGFLVGGPVGAALGWGFGFVAGAAGGSILANKYYNKKKVEKDSKDSGETPDVELTLL